MHNSENQRDYKIFRRHHFLSCLKENCFSVKLFLIFSLKIDNITLDTDLNWAKILDPNPNVFGSTTLLQGGGGRTLTDLNSNLSLGLGHLVTGRAEGALGLRQHFPNTQQ